MNKLIGSKLVVISTLLFSAAFNLESGKAEHIIQPRAFFSEFRSTVAADLFRKILSNPKDIQARKRLAEFYSTRGYIAVSDLVKSSAVYLEAREMTISNSEKKIWWACNEPEDINSILGRAREIKSLVDQWQFDQAQQLSIKVLNSDLGSCRITVEWARSVLLANFGKEGLNTQDWVLLELATRWLITSAEEMNIYPAGLESKARIFELLSDYFSANEDIVSAYVSMNFAVDRLKKSSQLEKEVLSENFSAKLEKLRLAARSDR